MNPLDATAASGLVSAALLAALVERLALKGMLTAREVIETYEHALLLLETQQASVPAEMAPIYAAAREVIEEQLRS